MQMWPYEWGYTPQDNIDPTQMETKCETSISISCTFLGVFSSQFYTLDMGMYVIVCKSKTDHPLLSNSHPSANRTRHFLK